MNSKKNKKIKKLHAKILKKSTREALLLQTFTIGFVLSMMFYLISALIANDKNTAVLMGISLVIAIINYLFYHKSKHKNISYHTAILLVFSINIYQFYLGLPFFWFFIFPLLAVLLLDNYQWLIYSIVLLVLAIIIHRVFNKNLSVFYSFSTLVKFSICYIIIIFLVFIGTYIRNVIQIGYDNNLEDIQRQNKNLHKLHEESKHKNKELSELKDKIKEKHLELDRIIQNLGNGFVKINFSSCITFANKEAQNILGESYEHLIGKPVKDYIDKSSSLELIKRLQAANEGKKENIELTIKNKNNKTTNVISTVYPNKNQLGIIVDFIIIFKDISAIKLIETSLKDKNKKLILLNTELRHSNEKLDTLKKEIEIKESRLSHIIENQTEGFTIIDSESNIKFSNPATKTIFDVEGMLTNIDNYITSEKISTLIKRTNWEKENQLNRYIDILSEKGRRKHIEITLTADYDKEGNNTGFICILRDQTTVKIVQDKLKNSQRRLSAIFNNVQVGIMIINPLTELIIEINDTAVKMIGYSKNEMKGKKCSKFITFDKDRKTGIKGENFDAEQFESILLKKDGTQIPILKTVVPTRINGEPRLIKSFVNITELKIAQEEIENSQKRLYSFINSIQVGIIIIDFDTEKIDFVNKKAQSILNKKPEDLISKKYHSVFRESIYNNQHQYFNNAIEYSTIETTIENEEDDTVIHVLKSVKIIKIKNKKYIIKSFVDISELKKAQHLVEEKNHQQKILINNLPAHIYFKNLNLEYILANDSFIKLLGYNSGNDIYGERDINLVNLDLAYDYEDIDEEVILSKQPMLNYEDILEKDGVKHWMSTSKVPYLDKSGVVQGVIGIVNDITDQKLRETEIKELNNNLKSYFVAIEQSPLGFVFIDKRGIRKYINQRYLELTGFSDFDLIGKQSSLFDKENKDLLKRVNSGETLIQESYKENQNNNYYERRFISTVLDEQNEIIMYVSIIQDVTKEVEQQKIISQQNHQLSEIQQQTAKSLQYARFIQQSILPNESVITNNFKDYFIFFKPKELVGGDFYYFNQVSKDKLIFAVADCTGHGVPGAFISMLSYSLLNEVVAKDQTQTASDILHTLRNNIKTIFNNYQAGMDIALCKLTKDELEYSGANNPLYLLRDKQLLTYKATSNPVGLYPVEQEFKTHKISLRDNDILYLLSDGYTDQFGENEHGKICKFSKKRLRKLLLNIGNLDMKKQKQTIANNLDFWMDGAEQIDDISLLGLKWKKQ